MAYFSLVFSNVTIVKEQFIMVQKVFLQFLCKLQLDRFFRTWVVDRTNFIQKEGYRPGEKKPFAYFLSYYRLPQESSNFLSGPTWFLVDMVQVLISFL